MYVHTEKLAADSITEGMKKKIFNVSVAQDFETLYCTKKMTRQSTMLSPRRGGARSLPTIRLTPPLNVINDFKMTGSGVVLNKRLILLHRSL